MLKIPERINVVRSLQAYTRESLPELDPSVTTRRGFIGGMIKSLASALHDWYVMLKKYADREPFPQTATEGFFATGWWIDITGLARNPAAAARGSVVVTGASGSIVAAGTVITSGANSYTTDHAATIISQSLIGTSSAPTALRGRFVTVEPHNFGQGQFVTFSGCAYLELNGTFEVSVIDANTVEYDVVSTISDPVEPNPRATGSWANVQITATETGPASNLDSGASLVISAPPSGVDPAVLMTFEGIADGSDLETLESWRSRVLEALGTDFGMFSAAEISIVAKTVPGVTRVFVRKPTREPTDGYPLEGQVRIAFLRDNDADPIPSALEVAQVREKIVSTLAPAHTHPDDVEVLAPERYSLDIRFRSIKPDTPGMRASISANVKTFMLEEATWGGTLSIEGLRCAIRASFDADTGARLQSYELDTPTLDIGLPIDAYPVVRSIAWLV